MTIDRKLIKLYFMKFLCSFLLLFVFQINGKVQETREERVEQLVPKVQEAREEQVVPKIQEVQEAREEQVEQVVPKIQEVQEAREEQVVPKIQEVQEEQVFPKVQEEQVFPKVQKEQEVHQILSFYQQKNSVTMDIKKKFIQAILKKESESSGKLYLAQDLWRLDISSPQKNSLIFDGNSLFHVSDSGSHHIPSSQSSVLKLIFDLPSFEKSFKYENRSQKGRTRIYHFRGLEASTPKKISIQIEKDRILSLHIEWEEPLGEEMYWFSSILFNQQLNPNIFKVTL